MATEETNPDVPSLGQTVGTGSPFPGIPAANVRIGTNANDTIGGTDDSDALLGQAGNDTVSGLGGDDLLIGGPGNDALGGGLGDDAARYNGSALDYTITQTGNQVTVAPGTPTLAASDGTDRLSDIERLEFSDRTIVVGGNNNPYARPDQTSARKDAPVTIPAAALLRNDREFDGEPLTITAVSRPTESPPTPVGLPPEARGQGTGLPSVRVVGSNVVYDPGRVFRSLAPGQTATDTFFYTVSDSSGLTDTQAVRVTIYGGNQTPAVPFGGAADLPLGGIRAPSVLPSAIENQQTTAVATDNPIVVENQKPGNPPSEWNISGDGDTSIQGFATDISVNRGETVNFKINTNSKNYRVDIYRLGYYGGMGARKVASISRNLARAQRQPAPLTDPATGLVDAGNWANSASWAVPADATSGVYIAKLVRLDGSLGSSHIPFMVRNDGGTSALLFQTSDTTWQAYNTFGGNNFYQGSPAGRSYKVSYNRPFSSATFSPVNRPVFDSEYPMIRWLEANGYDVSYMAGVDTARRGNEIPNHKVFLSVGHDEYWSGDQRANVEAARRAGVNLAFFSGNEMYWKTRWENNNRTLVTYKETWANARIDPQDPPTATSTWRDLRFGPSGSISHADSGRPENGVTGTIFSVDSYRLDTMTIPAADGKMRFWRNTSIANLAPGQTATLTGNVLGYEWDEDLDNGFRPASPVRGSSTTLDVPNYVSNFGNTVAPGTATHNLTFYRDPTNPTNPALVFGAGTTRWSWGLDSNHINEPSTPDPRMQQATVNLFADMDNIDPDTPQPGLVLADPSTDTAAPVSTITFPTNGGAVQAGSTVTITGTSSDAGGGVVGGVEVSTDGGTTWRRATGRENWSYSWTSQVSTVIKSRAVDDSLNAETPGPGSTVTVQPSTGPWSLWSNSVTPGAASVNDPSAVEVGVKFRADTAGSITGLRFYKGPANTGTHVGNLWTATGQNLATATFANETASGWQQVNLPQPVPITANTTYVASYHTNVGGYAGDNNYFATTGVDSGPLHALSSPESGGNGVYAYGSASSFPTNSYLSTNYWADVVFSNTVAS